MANPIFDFAHSPEILTPIIERYGCGWFDGGCYIFARALQLWLGGCFAVLVREELLSEQAFDHVVLRVGNLAEALYIDADGSATRSELLARWQNRERLPDVQLEDPAERTRFVGQLRNDSLSIWLAQQLRRKFGDPAMSWLNTAAREDERVQIDPDI
jgi:hypothetical protein